MLSDKRLTEVVKTYGANGLGVYFVALIEVECLGEGCIQLDQILVILKRKVSRRIILSVMQDFGLFHTTSSGLVFSVDPLPGYSAQEMQELRQTDSPYTGSPGICQQLEFEGTEEKPLTCERAGAQAGAQADAQVGAQAGAQAGARKTHAGEDKTRQDKMRIKTRAQRPSLEEVKAYCEERQNGIDAQHFLDFYEARNWTYGRTRITDWKACVRTWERRQSRVLNTPTADSRAKAQTSSTEYTDSQGNRFVDGRPIPKDAPPRPSDTALWDDSTGTWLEFYN